MMSRRRRKLLCVSANVDGQIIRTAVADQVRNDLTRQHGTGRCGFVIPVGPRENLLAALGKGRLTVEAHGDTEDQRNELPQHGRIFFSAGAPLRPLLLWRHRRRRFFGKGFASLHAAAWRAQVRLSELDSALATLGDRAQPVLPRSSAGRACFVCS